MAGTTTTDQSSPPLSQSQTPSENSNSGGSGSVFEVAAVSSKNSNKENTIISRESKRRKNCPTALDKIEEFTSSDQNFSFTFDTKFTGYAADVTPRFGSFNLTVVTPEKDQYCQIPATIEEINEESDVQL